MIRVSTKRNSTHGKGDGTHAGCQKHGVRQPEATVRTQGSSTKGVAACILPHTGLKRGQQCRGQTNQFVAPSRNPTYQELAETTVEEGHTEHHIRLHPGEGVVSASCC